MENPTDQPVVQEHVQRDGRSPAVEENESAPALQTNPAPQHAGMVPRLALLAAAFLSAPPIDSLIQHVVSPGGGGGHGW